jgi:YgiT-type zinc finger domain-containing protein
MDKGRMEAQSMITEKGKKVKCYECGKGTFKTVKRNMQAYDSGDSYLNFSDVEIEECSLCGEQVFSEEQALKFGKRLDKKVAEISRQHKKSLGEK